MASAVKAAWLAFKSQVKANNIERAKDYLVSNNYQVTKNPKEKKNK
jgi:hypothetical protein